jgi:hypothetical protein
VSRKWGILGGKIATYSEDQSMLNHYNGAVTFILQMSVIARDGDITSWISGRSARATFECSEIKTRRFEWFLSSDNSKATLIEVFDDSEGALTRFQNLMSGPIAAEWIERFEIESLTVLGDASDSLREAIASMEPDIRTFAGGFNKA